MSAPGRISASSSPPYRAARSDSRAASRGSGGDGAQHLVAGDVTEPVVDALEVVDVDHHERQRLAGEPACALDLVGQALLEEAAIRQARQRVLDRLPLDDLVQVDVLERLRGLLREVAEQLSLGLGERPAAAGDRDEAGELAGLGAQRERDRGAVVDEAAGGGAGVRTRGPRRRRATPRRPVTSPLVTTTSSAPSAPVRAHARPASAATPSHMAATATSSRPAAVEVRGERLAQAAERAAQALALDDEVVLARPRARRTSC